MILLLFLAVLGIIAMVLSLIPVKSYTYLKQTGIKTEGVVFGQRVDDEIIMYSRLLAFIKTKAIVRFTTQDQQWIDVVFEQNIPAFLNDKLKVGKTVELYYDPQNPYKIFLDTGKAETEGRILFFIIGLLITTGAIYLTINFF